MIRNKILEKEEDDDRHDNNDIHSDGISFTFDDDSSFNSKNMDVNLLDAPPSFSEEENETEHDDTIAANDDEYDEHVESSMLKEIDVQDSKMKSMKKFFMEYFAASDLKSTYIGILIGALSSVFLNLLIHISLQATIMIIMLSLLFTTIFILGISKLQQHTKIKNMKIHHRQRLMVAKALGSIHASLPNSTIQSIIPTSQQHLSYMKTITQLTENTCTMILLVDLALSSLRIATSLRLSLGSASQCVGRVEDATIGRQLKHLQSALSSKPMSIHTNTQKGQLLQKKHLLIGTQLGLTSSRMALYSIMRRQAIYLHSLCEITNTNKYIIEDEQERWPVSPPIISLSTLHSCRWKLTHLISNLVQMTFDATADILHKNKFEDSEKLLSNIITYTNEGISYLQTSFPLCSIPDSGNIMTDSINIPSTNNNNDPKEKITKQHDEMSSIANVTHMHDISSIRTRLDSATISLWTFEKELVPSSSHDRNIEISKQNPKEERNCIPVNREAIESWENMKKSVEEIYILHKRLESTFHNTSQLDDDDLNNKCSSIPSNDKGVQSNPPTQTNPEKSEFHYDCIPDDSTLQQYDSSDPNFTMLNKTIVFSGLGNVPLRPPWKTKKGNQNITLDPSDGLNTVSLSGETNLMEELSKRLKTMDIAEEYDTSLSSTTRPTLVTSLNDDSIHDSDQHVKVIEASSSSTKSGREKKQKADSVSSIWLGASGSLLSELRNAIDLGEK